jgi:hypothetical protein
MAERNVFGIGNRILDINSLLRDERTIQELLKNPRTLEILYDYIFKDPDMVRGFYEQLMKEIQGIPRTFPFSHSHSGSDTKSTTETLSGDTDFILTHMTGNATSLSATLQIKDDRLGWNLFEDPVDLTHFFGPTTSQYFDGPFYFAAPYRFAAAGSFVVETVDSSGSANTINIALHGYVVLKRR